MEDPIPQKNIKDYALGLLARKDYSKQQFENKLLSKNYSIDDINDIIGLLIKNRIFKEENFVRSIIIKRMNQGYSPIFIQNHLETKGVSTPLDEIYSFFEENGINEKIQMEKLVAKKFSFSEQLEDEEKHQKMKAKVLRFLISRGHDHEDSISLLESIIPSL
jgi:regulatory protein